MSSGALMQAFRTRSGIVRDVPAVSGIGTRRPIGRRAGEAGTIGVGRYAPGHTCNEANDWRI
jgi:hypothetical protein